MKSKIISVESKKGGVGKTTIALNVASLLQEKGYIVLLLDCDITGTSTSESVPHSDYWSGRITSLNFNLIDLFDKQVLSGKKDFVDSLFMGRNDDDNVLLIGSDIYDKNSKLILDPRLLMDELHSYWFIEMLKLIVDTFEKYHEGKPTVVVIDNSPGYIGVSKSIREWLCSLGPEFGKFLLVSSLDIQDVQATANSAIEIVQLMESMNKVALYCQSKGEIGDYKTTVSTPLLTRFYNTLKDAPDAYPPAANCCMEPNTYAQILFNKIPRQSVEDGWHYAFNDAMGGSYDEKIAQLMRDEKDKPLNAIYYHDRLSTQFFSSFLVNYDKATGSFMKGLSAIRNEDTNASYPIAFHQRLTNLNALVTHLAEIKYKTLSRQILPLFDYYTIGNDFSTLVKSLPSPTNVNAGSQSDVSNFVHFQQVNLDALCSRWGSNDNGYHVLGSIIIASFENLTKRKYRKDRIFALSAMWTIFFWHHKNIVESGIYIPDSNVTEYLTKTYSTRVNYSKFNDLISKVAVADGVFVNYSGLTLGEFSRFNKNVINVLVSLQNLDIDKEILDSLIPRIMESSEHSIPSPLYDYLKKTRLWVRSYQEYKEKESTIFEMKDITSILNGIIKGWNI